MTEQQLPLCRRCGGPTEEPRGDAKHGNMMIMRCRIAIVPTDWCVFCRKCKIHFHAPGRIPPKSER